MTKLDRRLRDYREAHHEYEAAGAEVERLRLELKAANERSSKAWSAENRARDALLECVAAIPDEIPANA